MNKNEPIEPERPAVSGGVTEKKKTVKNTKKARSRAAQGSAFRVWFEAQYGKRPNAENATDEKLREMITLGDGAARELYSRNLYDAKRTSALYAWQAKDVPESEIMRRMTNTY